MDAKGTLTGMLAIYLYSTKKLLFSKKVVVVALITVFLVGIMAYAASEANKMEEKEGVNDQERISLGVNLMDVLILFFFMPIIAMVYGASVIKDEIEDRSITHIVVSPLRREFTYLAYYASLVVSLGIVMVVIITAGFLTYFGGTKLDSDAMGIYGNMLALVLIGTMVYSAFFLFLSVLMNKPLYLGLFYAFIWEGFIGSLPGKIGQLALKHYIRSLGAHWLEFGDIVSYKAASVGWCAQVLVGVMVFFLAFGMVLIRTKEFP